jgi:hypothetical protein
VIARFDRGTLAAPEVGTYVGRAAVRSFTLVAHAGRARGASGGGVGRFVAVWWWWRARRLAAFVHGSGPPSVRFSKVPPGRPLGKPGVLDGRGGWGWRAAGSSIGPRRWRAYAARVADVNAGSRPAGRCSSSASAEQGTQADQPNRGHFTRLDALNRRFDRQSPSAGWLSADVGRVYQSSSPQTIAHRSYETRVPRSRASSLTLSMSQAERQRFSAVARSAMMTSRSSALCLCTMYDVQRYVH